MESLPAFISPRGGPSSWGWLVSTNTLRTRASARVGGRPARGPARGGGIEEVRLAAGVAPLWRGDRRRHGAVNRRLVLRTAAANRSSGPLMARDMAQGPGLMGKGTGYPARRPAPGGYRLPDCPRTAA